MYTHKWHLQDAKNKLSSVVDAAQNGETQIMARRGSPTTVTSSAEISEHTRQQEMAKTPSFIDHLLAIPTKENLFERSQLNTRDIDLEDTRKTD